MEEQRDQEQKTQAKQIAETQRMDEVRRLQDELMGLGFTEAWARLMEQEEKEKEEEREEMLEMIRWLVRGLLVIALSIWVGITLRPYLQFFLRQVFRALFLTLSNLFRNLAAML